MGHENIWDKNILSSKNYHEFSTWHLKELVRLRFLKSEWPSNFAGFLLSISGEDLLVLSQLNNNLSYSEVLEGSKKDTERPSDYRKDALVKAKGAGMEPAQFGKWSGFDLLFDLYRLRSADELALKDIGTDRLSQYRFILNSFLNEESVHLENDPIHRNMLELMNLLKKFLNGIPSDHFEVDLNTGKVQSLKNQKID